MKIRNSLESLIRDDSAATLVEYGLLLSLVVIAAIAALTFLSGGLQSLFSNVKSDL